MSENVIQQAKGASKIEPSLIDDFRRDGAVAVRGALADWVERLRAGIERNRKEPGPDAKHYRKGSGDAEFFGDYCNWSRIPEYRDFCLNSPAAEIAGLLMGASSVRLFHEHVLVKDAGAQTATPWHQDMPYYPISGTQTCSIWLVLDPVRRENSLEFVAGSHLWGKFFRPERFNRQALNPDDGLESAPDIEGERGRYRILGWNLSPGDAVAFDFRALHGAPGNSARETARRAFSSRWVGEDVRFARKTNIVTSPPFPEVDLADGAPLNHPSFPLIWQRAPQAVAGSAQV
jgi:ectoine hydroxylase-related dioxygenase (phytanoyl-CoA dioxygenase family)